MIDLERKDFVKTKDILIFVLFFIALFVAIFPKNISFDLSYNRHNYNDIGTKIKYLQSALKKQNNPKLRFELANSYFQIGNYNKALDSLNYIKPSFRVLALKEKILEGVYFNHKNKKNLHKLLSVLEDMAKLAFYKKEMQNVYQKTIALNNVEATIKILKILQTKNKNYLIPLIDVLMWKHKNKELLQIVKQNENKQLPKKVRLKIIEVSYFLKNKQLLAKIITKIDPKTNTKQVIDGYLFLGEPKKAYMVAKKYKFKNIKFLAKLALWSDNYQDALKYYQKLYTKHPTNEYKKMIYKIALALNRYDIMENILIKEVKNGDFSKIKDLEFVFMQNFHLQKGAKFFDDMYKKHHLNKFLVAEFYFYDVLGETSNMKKIANKMGKNITPYAALQVSGVYLGEKNPQKAYELLLLASKNPDFYNLDPLNDKQTLNSNKYMFYKTLYSFALLTHHKQEAVEVLKKVIPMRENPYDLVSLANYYEEKEPQKAFDILIKSYSKNKNNIYYFFKLFNIAYKLKKWKFVIRMAKDVTNPNILNKPYFWDNYASAYQKIGDYAMAKNIYLKSFRYTYEHNGFYWFLVNNKDKSIKQYLGKIKDKQLLLATYNVLGYYKKEKTLIDKMLRKKPNDFGLLVAKYNLLSNMGKMDEKLSFRLYKMCLQKIKSNKAILYNENFFQVYFNLALKYGSMYKIKKLMKFAKRNFKDFDYYKLSFYSYYGDYSKLKSLRDAR